VATVRSSDGPMPAFSCGNERFVYESNRESDAMFTIVFTYCHASARRAREIELEENVLRCGSFW
jgi:hypothetical protein